MRSLLVLYMVNHLFISPTSAGAVLGFDGEGHALEGLFGPLATQALSSQIYGLYTGFVYFAPFFGGHARRPAAGAAAAVIAGAVLMAIGHFHDGGRALFFPALMFLILGNGCFKPNISTQVGALYPPGDTRRDARSRSSTSASTSARSCRRWSVATLGQRVRLALGLRRGRRRHGDRAAVLSSNQRSCRSRSRPDASQSAPVAGLAAYIVGIPLLVSACCGTLTLAQRSRELAVSRPPPP
jgi:hypothetical protein